MPARNRPERGQTIRVVVVPSSHPGAAGHHRAAIEMAVQIFERRCASTGHTTRQVEVAASEEVEEQ